MSLMFSEGIYKKKPWGSETWLVSAHPDGRTMIKSGEFKGRLLNEVYEDFPLLVKIIDAKDDLSIQVHPNDEYAQKNENSNGKTECWYILEAKENASLIIGHNAQTKEELREAVEKGGWKNLLREVKVKKGDFFRIDPGTLHAIRGGVKLLEIQEPCDITYRLYDYDRLEDGKKRELHIDKCLDTIVCPYEEKRAKAADGKLASCPSYTVEKLIVKGEALLKPKKQPTVVYCTEGSGTSDGERTEAGDCFIVPGLHETHLKGDMEIIISCEKRGEVRIGIDLGGTNIAVGLVDKHGKIIDKISAPTKSERGIEAICNDIEKMCGEILAENNLSAADIVSAGIGCPGTVDPENGVVVYSNNIRMDNVPLRDILEKKLGVGVHVENDANAAAYGEYVVNFKGARSLVLVTLGTGVGSGLVSDGKIYRGFNGAGFECGHMIIHPGGEKCTCGSRGCLEAYASASALERRGRDTCKNIFALAKEGSGEYKKTLDGYITDLSIGIANIINIVQPEVLAIGGGVSNEGDALLAPLAEKVRKYDFNRHLAATKLVAAGLGNDAGIIGAAMGGESI